MKVIKIALGAFVLGLACSSGVYAGASASASWSATFVVEDLNLTDGIGASMLATTWADYLSSPNAGFTCCGPQPVANYFRPVGKSIGVEIQPFPPGNSENTESNGILTFTLTPNTRLTIAGSLASSGSSFLEEPAISPFSGELEKFVSSAFGSASVSVIGVVSAVDNGSYSFVLETGPTAFEDYVFSADLRAAGVGFFEPIPAPVPEPQTWAFLAAGLGMVALGARRRSRQQPNEGGKAGVMRHR